MGMGCLFDFVLIDGKGGKDYSLVLWEVNELSILYSFKYYSADR